MRETTKSMLVYVVLITFVSLAIVILLQAGSEIKAPASVAGQWQTQAPAEGSGSCPDLPFSLSETVLTIQQSGPMLHLYFTGQPSQDAFAGHLEGLQFKASTQGDNPMTLQGSLNRQAQPNTIFAILSGMDCPTPISFTSVRQAGGSADPGGH